MLEATLEVVSAGLPTATRQSGAPKGMGWSGSHRVRPPGGHQQACTAELLTTCTCDAVGRGAGKTEDSALWEEPGEELLGRCVSGVYLNSLQPHLPLKVVQHSIRGGH